MRTGEYSVMAERVAVTRALHQLVDETPRVFEDPLAVRIIGPENERWVRDSADSQRSDISRQVRAMICIRARFAEDELAKAIAAGATQYVVLGAGLDTFAYRRVDLGGRVAIFEVDHPATQEWKRGRLAEAGIEIPKHLHFVPVDFTSQRLSDCLATAGFRRDQPAFFSWLGVTYYLPRESVAETLGYIASQSAHSQVVFDYAVAKSDLPEQGRNAWDKFNSFTSRVGEPWQTSYALAELIAHLKDLGFTEVSPLTPEQANERYLAGRTDLPRIGPFVGLISAGHRPG